jgi:indolepyruvate ferredoxin oxidoreductase beta subunit
MVAQELAEAVRFAGDGLLKADSTAIVNEHRFLTTVEKMPITKNLIPVDEQIAVLKRLVGRYLGIDAHELALAHGMKPVYANTILLGALAASNALPISKDSYIDAIEERFSGKVMDDNIEAFKIGYKHIMMMLLEDSNRDAGVMMMRKKREVTADTTDITEQSMEEILSRNHRRVMLSRGKRDADRYVELIKRLSANNNNNDSSNNDRSIPDTLIKIIAEGIGQLVEFEGWHHADRYMRMVLAIINIDRERGDGTFRLSRIYAMHLAGRLMRWEGPFEVARIKTRKVITDTLHYRDAYGKGKDVIVKVEALLQPNVEEMYGMVPKRIHDTICRLIPSWPEYIERRRYDGKPISIDLTSIGGYIRLWLLWKLSFMHKHSVRYNKEMEFVEHFTRVVKDLAMIDYELACMVADYAQYIRGFAHVRARNIDIFNTLVEYVVRKGLEMDDALAYTDHRITKASLRAAMNLITLDGEGKDKVIKFMDELYTLFKDGEYNKIYARLAMRQLVPL